jgi:hypothetical protein
MSSTGSQKKPAGRLFQANGYAMTLLEAMADPQLFAPWFRNLATWAISSAPAATPPHPHPLLKLGSSVAAVPARASSWRSAPFISPPSLTIGAV